MKINIQCLHTHSQICLEKQEKFIPNFFDFLVIIDIVFSLCYHWIKLFRIFYQRRYKYVIFNAKIQRP